MKEDLYITLIHKHLSGDISREEQDQLDSWLGESPDHQLIVEHIRQTWKLSGKFSEEVDINLDQDFALLQKKLDPTAVVKHLKNTKNAPKSRRQWWSIAAGILFLVLAGFVVRQFMGPGEIEMVLVKTAPKETKTVKLPDGSVITLNQNSELHYPITFTGKERAVEVSGELYFDIRANPEMPFVVTTPGSIVSVLGTIFSIADYKKGPNIFVTVKEGKVKLHPKGKAKSLVVERNEKATYMKSPQKLFKKEDKHQIDMAWYTKKLAFENRPLGEVFGILLNLYNVQVYVEDGKMLQCPFTGTFDNQKADNIIEAIIAVYGFELEKISRGTSYRLKGGSCE